MQTITGKEKPYPIKTIDINKKEIHIRIRIKIQKEVLKMKAINVSEDIFPLAKFKTQASRLLKQLKDSNRPIVITLNGSPAAVMITPEEFDRFSAQQRFMRSVESGLQDVKEGRTLSTEELDAQLDAQFGPLDEQ